MKLNRKKNQEKKIFKRNVKLKKFIKKYWISMTMMAIIICGFFPFIFYPFVDDKNTLYTFWGAIPMILLSTINLWYTIKISKNTDWRNKTDNHMDDFKDYMLNKNFEEYQELLKDIIDITNPIETIKYYIRVVTASFMSNSNTPNSFRSIISVIESEFANFSLKHEKKVKEFNLPTNVNKATLELFEIDFLYQILPMIKEMFHIYSKYERGFFDLVDKAYFDQYWFLEQKSGFVIKKLETKYSLNNKISPNLDAWTEPVKLLKTTYELFSPQGEEKIIVKSVGTESKVLLEYPSFDKFKESFEKDIISFTKLIA